MPPIEVSRALQRAAPAPVAVLATVGEEGLPHLVPVVFAVTGPTSLVWAVDAKPKRTRHLTRLRNLERDRRVVVLVHRYDDDWRRLWWVRLEGEAIVVAAPEAVASARRALAAKYHQYRDRPPEGPYASVTVTRAVAWSAAEG